MNKILVEGLKSLKPAIQSGVANWGDKAYYFNESDKESLLAEIDELAKPIKTIEELGYDVVDDYKVTDNINAARYKKLTSLVKIFLYSDGAWETNEEYLTQELHAAVEQEMKKRGWWK